MDLPLNKSWPEAVGRNVDEVVQEIQAENSSYEVVKVQEGSPTTRDMRFNRVRVFYNTTTNLVTSEPRTG